MQALGYISTRGTVVDIGARKAHIFAKSFKYVHAIDPLITEDAFLIYMDRNMSNPNVRLLMYDHQEVLDDFPVGSIDLVFFSKPMSDHQVPESIIDEIQLWIPRIIEGGYIGGVGKAPRLPGIKTWEDDTWARRI